MASVGLAYSLFGLFGLIRRGLVRLVIRFDTANTDSEGCDVLGSVCGPNCWDTIR